MITSLPTERDYKSLANSCLVQAFDIIFETDKAIDSHPNKNMAEKVWDYSQNKLNTAVVLIHQAIEAYMKASVCVTSPFLLIEGKRTDWPVLSEDTNKNFDEFYTLGSESLLFTFFATATSDYHKGLKKHIEDIRKTRNQIVHGISKQKLNPKALLINVLDTFTFFMGQDAWWNEMRNFHLDHPLNEGMNYESIETVVFVERLDYTHKIVGTGNLNKHFSLDLKARKYHCPVCLPMDKNLLSRFDYKWSFLSPNTSESQLATCVNCSTSIDVIRTDCPLDGCPGNVLWEDYICLTCGNDVAYELAEVKKKNIARVLQSLKLRLEP